MKWSYDAVEREKRTIFWKMAELWLFRKKCQMTIVRVLRPYLPSCDRKQSAASIRDLPTIAWIRPGMLLRRNGPGAGILAAFRAGAIMDKSGRRLPEAGSDVTAFSLIVQTPEFLS